MIAMINCNHSFLFFRTVKTMKKQELKYKSISENYRKTENNNYARIYINRPKINYKNAFKWVASIIFCIIILSIASTILLSRVIYINQTKVFFLLLCGYAIISVFIFLKRILVWCVKVYQSKAKFETRLKCCFEPSCSDYAILAIEKYGAIRGVIKTINRLRRCHPPGGIDYP